MTAKNKIEHFVPESVAAGMQPGDLDHLSKADKKKIIALLARVSEKSYRRGFQQGVEIGEYRIVDPFDFRFQTPVDSSPFTDSKGGFTSKERLYMEYREIDDLGLAER